MLATLHIGVDQYTMLYDWTSWIDFVLMKNFIYFWI